MAALIRIKGELLTYDRRTGLWTCENEFLEKRANRIMYWREPSLTHLEEVVDFERTAANYVIEYFGQGEVVHVDPYWNEHDTLDPGEIDSGA